MKKLKTLFPIIYLLLIVFSSFAHPQDNCEGAKKVERILKYHLWFLTLTKYNDNCSQVTQGDFNHDGRQDYAAVLTEVKPFDKYANGDDWYRTYVVVFFEMELPYNKYQPVFVRTDGNKPKGFSVKSIKTEEGHDLGLTLDIYSYTRYRWSKDGFVAIEHSAD